MASNSKQLQSNLHETHWLTQITKLLQQANNVSGEVEADTGGRTVSAFPELVEIKMVQGSSAPEPSNVEPPVLRKFGHVDLQFYQNSSLAPYELQTALETPTCILKIPDSITISNPEAYFSTHITLGPYNHFRNDLYKMELYKLQNTIQATETFQLPQLNQIMDQLKKLEIKIRSCFDKFLDIGSESLAWIMLIDGLFLLQLLTISNNEKTEIRTLMSPDLCLPSPFPLFVEQQLYCCLIEGNLMSQDEIVKDILMLENQIPLLVLKNILPENFSNKLDLLFFKFCDIVSPKRLPPHDIPEFMRYRGYNDLSKILEESHHLLHFLYLLIMDTSSSIDAPVGIAFCSTSFIGELLNVLASVLQIGFLQQLSEAVGLIQSLFGLIGRIGSSSSSSTGDEINSSPLIPSAEELRRVGVKLAGNLEDFHKSIRFVNSPLILTC